MKKNRFGGEYYKFVSTGDFSFALIDSESNEGPAMQIITKDGSYQVQNVDSVLVEKEKIEFHVVQDNLSLVGEIFMWDFHPLHGKAMGPFSIFSMECKHEVYSMFHKLKGEVVYNGNKISFENGYGYKEGDYGVNFPSRYVWYNSVGSDYGVTLAIATIPFGIFHFTGILGFVTFGNKEYDLCTYTGAKIVNVSPEHVEIRKGSYHLEVSVKGEGGYMLKAPVKGNMSRFIKENVAVETEFTFSQKEKVLLMKRDTKSSFEYMF